MYRPEGAAPWTVRRWGARRTDCEGGDGRCTANGRTIRRGEGRRRRLSRAPAAGGRGRQRTPSPPHASRAGRAGRRGERRPSDAWGGRRDRARRRSAAARRGAPGGGSAWSAARRSPLLCGGYATGAALGWGRAELALFMGDFGLASPRRSPPSPASSTPARRRQPLPARLAAVRALLRDGRRWATPSGAGTRSCSTQPVPQPSPRRPLLPAASRRPPSSACSCSPSGPVTRAGWVCLALDAWLIGGSLLTLSWSLALAHTATSTGQQRRAGRALARLPAARHRAGQHGARAALPALVRQPLRGQHRHRRARPDRAVRRAVHLAAAARALPLGPDAGRRLVRRLAAPRLRALGAPRHRHRDDGHRARPAVRSARRRRAAARPSPARWPRSRPYLAAAVCTLGILYNVLERPQRRPGRALHRLHGRARPGRAPGHHAARQHRAHPGTGPEGEPLPLPGAGLQRRHHDRRAHRHAALRQPGRRRGLRAGRRGARRHRTRLAHPPRGPRPGGPRGAPLPRRAARRGAHDPDRVPLQVRRPATGSTSSPPSTATRAA